MGIAILLLFLLWLFLQTTYGQNKSLPTVLNYLSKTLGTKITAGHVDVSFFDEIQLDDVAVLDADGDTLIFVQKLDGDIGLFSFLNKKLEVDNLSLKGTKFNLVETANGTYNFDHIINHLQSKDEKSEPEASNPWAINLDALDFKNIQLHLSGIGSELSISIPNLKGDLKDFSIPDLSFHFNTLYTSGIHIAYDKSTNVQIGEDEGIIKFPSLPFALLIDDLSVSGESITYNTNDPLLASRQFDPNHLAIENLELIGENFSWSDSIRFDLKELKMTTSDGFQVTHASTNLNLSNQAFTFGPTQIQTSTSDIEFSGSSKYGDFENFVTNILGVNSSLTFQKSLISKEDILYFIDEKTLSNIDLAYLNDLELEGNLNLRNSQSNIKNLTLRSGNELTLMGSLNITDISNFNSSNISFDISKISTKQSYLENLFPGFQYPAELNHIGNLNGSARGNYNQNELHFENIKLTTSAETKLDGSGRIYAFQDGKSPEFDFSFLNLESNLSTLFSDKAGLPEELKRLENIKYTGSINGNLQRIATNGKLSTTLGGAILNSQVEFLEDYTNAKYDGYIKTQDFDLGQMLNDSTLGVVNFDGNIKGQGLALEKLETIVDGKITSIYYDGNTYNDIEIDGAYKDKIFDGRINSKDKNLNFDVNGKLDLNGPEPVVDVLMDMKNFDLKELGFSDSLMVLGGIFKGKARGNSIDEIIGEGSIKNFSIKTHKGSYLADSTVFLKAENASNSIKTYTIESPFLDGEIKGKIEPSSLVRFVKNYIKAYIPLEIGYDERNEDNLDKYFEENEAQNFNFWAKTKDINPFLFPFLGNNASINKASIGIFFSSEETTLDIKGRIDSLLYQGILFQKGSFFFDGRKSFINGNINLEDISMDNEILVPQSTINAVLNNKIADFNLILANEDDVERLNLSGDMTRTDEYLITFDDSVFLNGFNWEFSPYNQIIFGDYGLYLQDLKLSKDKQKITIYTDENENGEAIEVLFNDFILSELAAIIDKENDYFEGIIEGSLMVNSLYSKPFITADLELNNITIAGHKAGNLSLDAVQDIASNSVKSNLRLSGPQNDATLTLDYGIENQSTTGKLDIGKLEMAIIDPYLTDIFINSEGYVNGNIDIKGNLNNLDLEGVLRTHNVKTTPVFTNSRYTVLDTDINFTDTKIDFGTVELQDKNGNPAFVSGKINHRNLRNSVVDLKVKTDNFEFLNTTENENELFYGNVNIRGNVTVNGPIDDIKIDGNVNAINSSRLIVSPLSLEEELLSDDFIIYSGDPRKIHSDSLQLEVETKKVAIPFDVDLKVNVAEDSEFTMILNPITGDKLTCNGNSDLILKLSKAGEMELFGTYTVTEGGYIFSFGPITKEFKILPDSKVELNGDPLDAILDVEAVYIANTAVFDLLQLESDLTDAQKSEARRKRDINVILSLSKSIKTPEIKLDFKTNENELATSITDILDRKLNQLRTDPDELNNQVFGLLLFNNFSLAKNSETDLTQTGTDFAIRSLGDLVTSQLNKLADGLIEGFELNIDVNTYGSNYLALGQVGVITEFGFDIKKSLFDSRLTITAGTNINLESSATASNFNTIAGDFLVEYKLTENGSLTLKAFRKSSVNRLETDQSVSKNGGSFFIRKEFGEIQKNKN